MGKRAGHDHTSDKTTADSEEVADLRPRNTCYFNEAKANAKVYWNPVGTGGCGAEHPPGLSKPWAGPLSIQCVTQDDTF